ncbi:hypothetical protein B7494_g3866 [Chlorociboria aeruginascens]|nr:hypothetical protein B7494_g3866 [Chlorociboria aeruginascens]
MVNVLILGATGYIGHSLTQRLTTHSTHKVYGLVRTPTKATSLLSQEVTPIIGSLTSPSLLTAISEHNINVIVNAAEAQEENFHILREIKKLSAARLETAARDGTKGVKLGYIYISGTWVHGSSLEAVDDLTPVAVPSAPTPPVKLTAWRPELEREVLTSTDVLDVLVIRPALVYGRSSWIWNSLFTPIYSASRTQDIEVGIPIEPASRPGLIHVDDVASGVHAAIEKLPLIAGTGVYPVFDLVTSMESMRDILLEFGRVTGYKGRISMVGPGEDLFMDALGTSFNGCSERAKGILGWEPKRVSGFVSGMAVFAKAWEVSLG